MELIVVNREGIYSSGLLGTMKANEAMYHVFEDSPAVAVPRNSIC